MNSPRIAQQAPATRSSPASVGLRIINSLHEHASQRPEAIAIIAGSIDRPGEDVATSYQQLAARVSSRALWLQMQHCQTLAFQLDNGLEWVITDLAGLQAGVDIVPIPSFFSQQQITHVLDDAQADLFLTDQPKALSGVSDRPSRSQWQAPLMPLEDASITVWQRKARLTTRRRQPLKLTYTSGSTGTPRGVCLAFQTIDAVASSINSAMAPLSIERHLCLLPLATLLENIAGLYAPMIRGATVQAPSLWTIGLTGARLDFDKFCATLNSSQADSIIIVPQLLTALVTLAEFGLLQTASLKMIAVGGGRVSEHLLTRANKLGLPVYQGYGLSECASVLTLNLPDANRPGSVGRALPHAELRINKDGEIEARGSNMRGYLDADALVVDDVTENIEEQWYATGDLGRIDADGFVFVTGRIKHVFITSLGRNVSPEWVESSLTQHPAIAQALVTGEGRDHNLALIWTGFAQTPEELDRLVALANAELPDYARSHAHIVMDTALPPELITANGRLKRQLALTQFQHVINNHYINEHDFNEHDFNEHDINNHNEPITDITLRTTRGTTPRTTR
jgi:long-subunit acyl-CoA synthetase (AMP-forming)